MEYNWSAVSLHRYERPMDDVEIHYKIISNATVPLGRQMWATSACIGLYLNTNNLVGDIRKAWTAVRWRHPSIANTVQDDKKVYEVLRDQTALGHWLDETVVHIGGASSKEVFPKLSSHMVGRSTLFVLSKTNEVIVRITHENADAEGVIRVLDRLAWHLANPSHQPYPFDGSETARLSLPFASSAPLPKDHSDEGFSFAQKALEDYGSNIPGQGLPAKKMNEPTSDANRVDYAFSTKESSQIIKASKASGLTPFHVFQTASMMATYKLSENKDRKYATFGIFGLRKHCTEPVKSDPTSISIIGWPVVYEPPYESFSDLSTQVKSFYTGFAADPRLLYGLKPHWEMMKVAMSPEAPKPPPASDPMISSVGVVDPLLQRDYVGERDVVVKDFWMATNVMTPNPAVHLWTWQNVLRYAVSYNEMHYDEADVEHFVDVVVDIVRKELLRT